MTSAGDHPSCLVSWRFSCHGRVWIPRKIAGYPLRSLIQGLLQGSFFHSFVFTTSKPEKHIMSLWNGKTLYSRNAPLWMEEMLHHPMCRNDGNQGTLCILSGTTSSIHNIIQEPRQVKDLEGLGLRG